MKHLEEFIQDLSEDLEQRLFAPSIKFLTRKFYAEYGTRINENIIYDYLSKDNRFIKVNNNQFASKSRLAKYIETLTNTMDSTNEDDILNKLKERMFISEIDNSVLKQCLRIEKEFQYETKGLSPILHFKEELYDINSLKDVVNIGLDKGYLSIEVIEEASRYFQMHHEDIIDEFISKGIEIRSDENINFKYSKTKNEKEHFASDFIELANDHNFSYELNSSGNILLTDLRMNELITCIFLVAFKGFISFKYISTKHIKEIERIKIAEIYSEEIMNTFLGNEVIVAFKKYLNENYLPSFYINQMHKYRDSQELSKSLEIKKLTEDVGLWEMIRHPLKELFLSHVIVERFTELIRMCNKEGKQSMFDIVKYAIINKMEWELKNVLIGKKASSGIKPINNGSDICLNCSTRKCKSSPNNMKKLLLLYRHSYADLFIKDIDNNAKQYKQILDDVLLLKFLIPYTIAVSTKHVFIKLDIIKPTRILYKNSGLYCPYDDEWVVS